MLQTDYKDAKINGSQLRFSFKFKKYIAATWMDLETITLSEVSQRKTNIPSLICGIYTNDTKELIHKTEIDSQTQKTNLQSPKSNGGEG